MNEYTDLKIVECNRLHSEEAKSNNNENFSLWTNNLQDILHLEPGDKVSVHGAMVSERGAGQSSSIEIKGIGLGFKKTFNYINISGVNASGDLVSGFKELKAVEKTDNIDIRDDTGLFKISYYVTMNGENVISLPRRWWYVPSRTINNFSDYDDRIHYGMSLSDPFNNDDYALYDDFYQLSGTRDYGETNGNYNRSGLLSKIKNDNSRFTLMVRDRTFYSEDSASGNLISISGMRDPENARYYLYEELKKVELKKGFNSPEFIAEEITRQLQNVISENTPTIRHPTDLTDNPNRPGFPAPYVSSYNTETYKEFTTAGIYPDISTLGANTPTTKFNNYINGSTGTTNASGYEWLQNFHLVGCKRPELYITGREINMINDNIEGNGISGTEINSNYGANSNGFVLNINYNKTNLLKWRNFIEAQEKYPEVWNIFSDSRTPYNASDTIENSRWFHMNRYGNASMLLSNPTNASEKAQLGWGGYIRPQWGNASKTLNLNSVVVPFIYDATQKDAYYDKPSEELGEKTYGCFGNSNGLIKIYTTENNGSGSTLFNKLNDTNNQIIAFRRCGYDLHFTAPATAWCLPYSGTSQFPVSYDARGPKYHNYLCCRNYETLQYRVSTNYLRSRLYIGANNPKLNWNGTNFTITDLHTAINRGNKDGANAKWVQNEFDADPQASDKVFKINPTELYNDWTPNRMPYKDKMSIPQNDGATAEPYFQDLLNINLEPFQIYDSHCGINIEDFNLTETEWTGSLWDLLGFSYKQFHSKNNTRLKRIDNTNVQDLSVITTNAQIPEGATKFYSQNMWGAPRYNTQLQITGVALNASGTTLSMYYPPIVQDANSIEIVADNLPTRMIRGYYSIRSNILTNTPFIGGKVNNTNMPIIGIVDKINGDGDFYFQQESSLDFTIQKPLRLASLTCSIHDPDGSYANTSEQNTILFKIQKQKRVTFNVVQEIIQDNGGKLPANL